ncbi:hypothetical protein WN943_007068 [Citrus x changshan-huyou]
MKCSRNIELMNNQALELVKCLWKEINRQQDVDVAEVIRKPTNLLFDAAEVGNFRFLAELIGSYPDFVHELDENGRSIFHIAILNRHMNVFNLIYEQGFNKQLLAVKSSHLDGLKQPSRWSASMLFKEEEFCSKLERKRSTRV